MNEKSKGSLREDFAQRVGSYRHDREIPDRPGQKKII